MKWLEAGLLLTSALCFDAIMVIASMREDWRMFALAFTAAMWLIAAAIADSRANLWKALCEKTWAAPPPGRHP